MMTDPKAVEAARRILKELPIDAADAQKVARALLAGEGNNATAAAVPFDPWQPISTAPKDGTDFLAFVPFTHRGRARNHIMVGCFAPDRHFHSWPSRYRYEPTLWQPLASPGADANQQSKIGVTQAARSDASPSSSPSPTVRDALDHLHAMAPGIRDLDALDAVEKDDESMRSAVRDVREALEWYGEQARLARLIHSEGDAGRHALAEDGGRRARAALSPSPQADK